MRTLLDDEIPLLRRLLVLGGRQERTDHLLIEPLADGSMGSFRIGEFAAARKLGYSVAEVHFSDADGILVTAVLNVDTQDQLFEVDVWKVDFSPLQRWPIEGAMASVSPSPSLLRTDSPPSEL